MPKSYWTTIQTPNGIKYFRADEVTDELLQKIKDAANDVFCAEYGVTSFDDIKAAYDAGKKICAVRTIGNSTYVYELTEFQDNEQYPNLRKFAFTCLVLGTQMSIYRFPVNWTYDDDTTFADSQNLLSLRQSMAPQYNNIPCPIPAGTYAIKDYVLYRSNTTITSESTYATWDDSQWDAVTVGRRLKILDDEVAVPDVFYAEYEVTPYADIKSAYDAGMSILCTSGGIQVFQLFALRTDASVGSNYFQFVYTGGNTTDVLECRDDGSSGVNGWSNVGSVYTVKANSIAPTYDSTRTYEVGKLCSHFSSIYRCSTAINSPEPWTPAHWTETTVANELYNASDIAILKAYFINDHFEWPTYNSINALVGAEKTVCIVQIPPAAAREFWWLSDQAYSSSNPYFTFTRRGGVILYIYSDGTTKIEYPIANSIAIAPAYSSDVTYPVVGTAVMHYGKLYVNNTAITTAENWTPAHWTETTVVELIANIH